MWNVHRESTSSLRICRPMCWQAQSALFRDVRQAHCRGESLRSILGRDALRSEILRTHLAHWRIVFDEWRLSLDSYGNG